ncbi:hypothetical protein Pla22_52380 [Rubripirellula amarantea]|uniref:ADP-ribosylation/crystallin J1 n=1 Tax=Rubripirellula amarantea TaxID=2527999 RepID=A0A5C5WCT3_9BACT|nr:hypothetical protein [Rubripirellula amarantea]TWT47871.1 hypothetical protein Pla22_52380 [Rubripirellula amarantea]
MQPSGEVGRFEVVDLLSPPADRNRYPTENIMRLYRPVGLVELELIAESGWAAYPPRLAHQQIFYPVLNFKYASAIANNWNTKDDASGHCGFVTEFDVDDDFAARYDIQTVGDRDDVELWVPSEELDDFNNAIEGRIVVTASYYGDGFVGTVDKMTGLPSSIASPHTDG